MQINKTQKHKSQSHRENDVHGSPQSWGYIRQKLVSLFIWKTTYQVIQPTS